MRAMKIIILSFTCVAAQIRFNGASNGRGGSQSRSFSNNNNRGKNSFTFSNSGGRRQNSNFQSGISSRIRQDNSIVSNDDGCVPAVFCSSDLFSFNDYTRAQCVLADNSQGFRCVKRTSSGSARRPLRTAEDAAASTVSLTRTSINNNRGLGDISTSIRTSFNSVNNITRLSSRQYLPPLPRTAAFYHAKFQRQARSDVKKIGKFGLLTSKTAMSLRSGAGGGLVRSGSRGGVTSDAVNFGSLTSSSQSLTSAGLTCSGSSIRCSDSRYRTADGSCNNLSERRYGMADTSLNRIVLPEYSDGVSAPRRSVTGADLPSARLLSSRLATDLDNIDQKHTYITMTFGQFVDHDITHSPIMTTESGQDIDCCRSGGNTDDFCAPINIPSSDPVFGRTRCMNLVRSVPAPPLDCSIRYREQVNQITHWLDASNIYGSDDREQRSIRASGGRLQSKFGPDFGSDLLPDDSQSSCDVGTCFKAGDGRVNENPMLAVMHTIFMREHNRVADTLRDINPGWSDEKIFQETKRFVTAEYQHIVYNEWLPSVVGKKYMNVFGLFPLDSGYSNDYDSSIDPRITNEFSSAAFRFGHSLIPSLINVYKNVRETFELKQTFNKPQILRLSGMVDGLVGGLTRDKMESFDSGFVGDVTNHLFDGDGVGMDLVSLNIQRGRDHGLAGYNKYREVCQIGRASSFSDLTRQMSVARVEELQSLYQTVDDIDLFVGIFSERPMRDAMVGPTALCIIGKCLFLRKLN